MGIYHHGALLSTSAPCTNSLPVTPQEPFENRGPRLTPQTTSMHLLSPWQALVYQPLVVTPSTYSNLAILLAMVIWILWDIICSCNKTFSIVSHDLTVMSLSSNEEFLTVLFITYLRGLFCRAECRTSAWMGVLGTESLNQEAVMPQWQACWDSGKYWWWFVAFMALAQDKFGPQILLLPPLPDRTYG